MFEEKLREKLDAQKAILEAAAKEGRAMTEDEQKSYDDLDNEIKGLEKTIAAQKAYDERKTEQKAAEEKAEAEKIKAEKERRNPVDKPLWGNPGASQKTVSDVRKEIFGSVGGYFQAIHKMRTDTTAAQNVARFNEEAIKIAKAEGMSENVPADGGFLVGTDVSTVLLEKSYETGLLVNRAFRLSLTSGANAMTLPMLKDDSRANGSRYGGLQMYWDGEGVQATGTQLKYDNVEMKLKKLMGLVYVTNELLEDAGALESWITSKFPEEQGFKLDDGILNGTGAGMPLGIFNSDAFIAVPKESGQAAATILAENIINMYARFDGNPASAVWVINREAFPQLSTMSIAIGTGGQLLYTPAGGLSGAPYGTIYNIPVLTMEQCAPLGTAGDIALIDMNKYAMMDKGGMKIASSMHIRFDYDEMAFRFTYRADGQPTQKQPHSPYKGSKTTSAFVGIAARS